jgi:hypothetical protein
MSELHEIFGFLYHHFGGLKIQHFSGPQPLACLQLDCTLMSFYEKGTKNAHENFVPHQSGVQLSCSCYTVYTLQPINEVQLTDATECFCEYSHMTIKQETTFNQKWINQCSFWNQNLPTKLE